jgi:hypothetical protein
VILIIPCSLQEPRLPSPFLNKSKSWSELLTSLVDQFQSLEHYDKIIKSLKHTWKEFCQYYYNTKIGSRPISEFGLSGSAIGDMMERLFSYRLEELTKGVWRKSKHWWEKDLTRPSDPMHSFEYKASGSKNNIQGRRDSVIPTDKNRKSIQGYFVIVNYRLSENWFGVRLGWLDDVDWNYNPDLTKSNKAFVDVAVQNTRLVEIFSMK